MWYTKIGGKNMGYTDENGNWVEIFRSPPYSTEEMAKQKIDAVVKFHVYESGWVLNGEPYVEKDLTGNYVAIIPLMKPAEQKSNKNR